MGENGSGIYCWTEVAEMPDEPIGFYLEHYIPVEGIVFLFGKYGTFKTPITVNLAKAIATGTPIFGLDVVKANPILYLEVDSPRRVIVSRFRGVGLQIGKGEADFAFFYPGLNVIQPTITPWNFQKYHKLQQAHIQRQYKVVFIDALRGTHPLSNDSSESPQQVYGALATLFPGAVIVVIHHDKKTKFLDAGVSDKAREEMEHESFSGSQAWVDHATVAIKIEHRNRRRRELALIHTKSQAGELQPPLLLRANETASQFASTHEATNLEIASYLKSLGSEVRATDKNLALAEKFGFSVRTAKRRRAEVETGHDGSNAVAQDSQGITLKLVNKIKD